MGKRSNRELENLKDVARTLYVKDNLTGRDIALKLNISEKTISEWKKKYSWDSFKDSFTRTREEQLKNLYDQFAELNTAIKKREVGLRFPDSKEANTLKLLTASIRDLEKELEIATIIDVFIEFLAFIRPRDFDKAQMISEVCDEFIQNRVK